MMASGVEIPYPDGDTRFHIANVPHGDIRIKRYFSKTANNWRRMFVYCPPGYDTSTQSYPVLYLQHGGGEDERGWSNQEMCIRDSCRTPITEKQILIIKCFSYTMILYYKDNTTINNIKRKNKMFFLILLHTTKFVQIKI